jgi:hypothetical protein
MSQPPTLADLARVRDLLFALESQARSTLHKVEAAYRLVDAWYWACETELPAGSPGTDCPPIVPDRLALIDRPQLPEPEPPAG